MRWSYYYLPSLVIAVLGIIVIGIALWGTVGLFCSGRVICLYPDQFGFPIFVLGVVLLFTSGMVALVAFVLRTTVQAVRSSLQAEASLPDEVRASIETTLPVTYGLFDLSKDAAEWDRRVRNQVIFLVGAGAIVAVFAVVILLSGKGAVGVLLAGSVTVVSATFVVVAAYRWSRRTPPISSIEISPEALLLGFEDGGKLDLRWDDPKFGLTLRDHAISRGASPDEREHFFVEGPAKRVGWVPRSAANAVIATARTHPLPIRQQIEWWGTGKSRTRGFVTRIGDLQYTFPVEGRES